MLPREIQTESWPDRTRIDLPQRPLGALRWIGLVPMAFGVFFAWMPAQQMVRSIGHIVSGGGSGMAWILVAFLSLFVVAGMMPFGFGLFILAGRTRLVVTRDRLIATELAGPFRWSRQLRFDQIEGLEFGPGTQAPQRETPALFRGMSGIAARMKNGRKFPVAIGYPVDWLRPLLNELVSTMQLRGVRVPVKEAELESALTAVPTETRAEKPAGSNIELADSGWSTELLVPSRGVWKDSYGLLGFGIVWCLIVGAISAAGLFHRGPGPSGLGAAGFLGLFWLGGIALLLTGIHLGTRRWSLRADRFRLQVTRQSALRSREWIWAASDISDVCVGDSGTRVNKRVIEQLQVHARTGRPKTGLLTGRTHEELAWVATILRQALGVRPAGAEPAEPPRIDASRKRS